MSATSGDSVSHYPLLENILFQNNLFKEMTGLALKAASFKNLVICQNSFINGEKAPITLKMRGTIRAQLGNGLWVEGNEWTPQNGSRHPASRSIQKRPKKSFTKVTT
jgi:hypothetical protein